ncbi:MAG: glycosyltransferase family 39 protein [Anaerolineae bacterium]|nr:glycosyltransferase family 39 protein [Anaerolineae bacterium]
MSKVSQLKINYYALLAVILAFFAFFMTALVSRTVFERLPHLEDEIAYLYQANIFAGGQIVIEQPQPRQAFWQPFVIDHNESGNRFGKYTPGWSAVLALGVLLGQAWVINGFLAALTVALVYRLGHEVFSPDVGIIAAILTAFSPAALLLNATLMAHTAALFYTTLFIYAYWRLSHKKRAVVWGAIAGIALGLLAASRPLTTVAIGLPFIVWSGLRLIALFIENYRLSWAEGSPAMIAMLKPLLMLTACTLVLATSIPLFNYAATGDSSQNLYELVWDYDQIGFGECCGRNGHTLEKGFNHAGFDLTLTASDLFGWQLEPITPQLIAHFQTQANNLPVRGYSFFLLPLGVITGLFAFRQGQKRQDILVLIGAIIIWSMVALAWVLFPKNLNYEIGDSTVAQLLKTTPAIIRDPSFAWIWFRVAMIGLLFPLILWVRWQHNPQIPYTWLLLSIVLGIVLVQMLYWIGSQRYSTRYYYEALTAAALLTALPLAWLAQKVNRPLVIGAVLLLTVVTLYHYSTPRIMALYRFNGISSELIAGVEERRTDDSPVLVIINGDATGDNRVRWRAYAALMAVTSPYLDSDIVGARDYGSSGMREQIVAQFPNRQIIEVQAAGNDTWFIDDIDENE